MADDKAVGAPALDTNIESGDFSEKKQQQAAIPPKAAAPAEDEDEDEDIDALIEDLESDDGGNHVEDDDEADANPAHGRVVPEDMLQTSSRTGLSASEVIARRRKYGLNQMKEEKENLILKFFSYFVGPIQFVMEVSQLFICVPLFPTTLQLFVYCANVSELCGHCLLVWLSFCERKHLEKSTSASGNQLSSSGGAMAARSRLFTLPQNALKTGAPRLPRVFTITTSMTASVLGGTG